MHDEYDECTISKKVALGWSFVFTDNLSATSKRRDVRSVKLYLVHDKC